MLNDLVKGTDYTGVCVVYFCHDNQGNFVMGKRGKNTRDEHEKWDIGGGGVKFGETIENTIKREVREEYCTDVLDCEFLGYRDVHRTHNGKPTHWVALDFKVLVEGKKVKNGEPEMFDEVKWFTLDSLPENVHSQFPNFLDLYKERLVGK
ncbi:MAG TPA: NUDIX domain-containing protein [archaeon]|nr:NUDIX domain-containing protein [archaeon]HLD81137.1 NUDIX domain-containing protein [archaeon]